MPGGSATFEYEKNAGRKFAVMSQGDSTWSGRLLGDIVGKAKLYQFYWMEDENQAVTL